MFIAGTACIFEDDYLLLLKPTKPIETIPLSHMCKLKLYRPLNPYDFYLVGVDTARSLVGDFCSIEIYQYSNFEQVGEFVARIGSLTKYSEVVKDVVKYLYKIINKRMLIGIENNSMGIAIVESLENDNKFDYVQFLYRPDPKKPGGALKEYGINTNTTTKDKMISIYYDYITSDSSLLHSAELISQLSIIEKKSNGSISAQTGQHDDLFMASCFCALMKKDRQLEIEPLININTSKFAKHQDELIKSIIEVDHKNVDIDMRNYFPDAEYSSFNYRSQPKEEFDVSDLPLPEFF